MENSKDHIIQPLTGSNMYNTSNNLKPAKFLKK